MSASAVRPDAAPKLLGQVEYGTDLDVPGMLWAVLVPSPVAHGTLRELDLGPARALPGVTAVGPEELGTLLPRGEPDSGTPLFARGTVVYHSQPIAAVAAPTLAAAREAAARVRVRIDPLPVVSDLEQLFPEWPARPQDDHPAVVAHVHARHGPLAEAFRGADHVVEETYRTASIHQVALEPHACLAEVRDGHWHVRTSTQSPFGVREDLGDRLGLPVSSIVVDGTWVGGGFGGKGASALEPYALVLARASGRPVRLALDYRTEFRLGRTTLPSVVRMATAVKDGAITGRRVRLLLDSGTSLPGRDFATGFSIGFLLGPYRTPAFEVEGYAVRTNKPPFGPHRAPFAPQCTFVEESHLDHVARIAGEDPEEFRARHLWVEGDRTALGQPVGPFGVAAAFERARATARAWRREIGPGTGVGVACGFWSTGTGAGGEVRLRLEPHGVTIVEGEREIGSGSVLIGLVAVAARALGVPEEFVRVEYGDTSHAPFDSGVYGSRTVGALGRAIEEAAGRLKETLHERMRVPGRAELSVAQGAIVVRVGGRERPLAEVLTPEELAAGGLVAEGRHYAPPRSIDEHRVVTGTFYPYTDFTGSVHVAQVTVDRATGAVHVDRYAAFQDVGVVVTPAAARAQVEGAVAMGLGTALTEEAIWTEEGRLANAGLLDYRIPTLGEIPPVDVQFVEGFLGAGPNGAKGLGEPPIIPVPAAVAIAVREACGAHVDELPLTAERVARALKLL